MVNKPLDLGPFLLRRGKVPLRNIWDLTRFGPGEGQQVSLSVLQVPVPVGAQGPLELIPISRIPGELLSLAIPDVSGLLSQDLQGGPAIFIEYW